MIYLLSKKYHIKTKGYYVKYIPFRNKNKINSRLNFLKNQLKSLSRSFWKYCKYNHFNNFQNNNERMKFISFKDNDLENHNVNEYDDKESNFNEIKRTLIKFLKEKSTNKFQFLNKCIDKTIYSRSEESSYGSKYLFKF